jgi:Mg2+ and Co2+ transporter CorA
VEICLIDEAGAWPVPEVSVDELLAREIGFAWIDFDHTDVEGMEMLTKVINAEQTDILDCSTRTPVPKIHLYADHLFSAINGVARGTDGRLHFQPLKVFLNDRFIITVLGPTHQGLTRESAHRELTAVRERLEAQEFRPTTGLDLVTAVRFEMLRAQEELTGSAARRIAALEQRVMQTDSIKAGGGAAPGPLRVAPRPPDDRHQRRADLRVIRPTAQDPRGEKGSHANEPKSH